MATGKLKIISFYTPDWQYPAHARRLERECNDLGLPCVIEARPNTGSYTANSRIKPQFIWEVMHAEPGPFLWVDVDGSILQHPDVAMTWRDHDIGAKSRPPDHPLRWHVGTLWIDTTPAAFEFVDHWRQHNQGTDDNNFTSTYHALGNQTRIFDLPPEYFWLQYKSHDQPPKDTVIMHRLSAGDQKQREKGRI